MCYANCGFLSWLVIVFKWDEVVISMFWMNQTKFTQNIIHFFLSFCMCVCVSVALIFMNLSFLKYSIEHFFCFNFPILFGAHVIGILELATRAELRKWYANCVIRNVLPNINAIIVCLAVLGTIHKLHSHTHTLSVYLLLSVLGVHFLWSNNKRGKILFPKGLSKI